MQIQQVEKQTGLTAQSIRFYEREGLILPERNPENRYRNYSESDVRRLQTIVFCRSMGIPISAIRRLLNGELSLQTCVEDALLDAKAAEAEAKRMANLCWSVLEQLQIRPELSAEDCVSAVLAKPSVRRIYEQVLPPECRKPAPSKNHFFWIFGSVVAFIGLLIILAIGSIATFRTHRNEIFDWVTDKNAVISFTYEDTTKYADSEEGRYLQFRLVDLLLEPAQAQAVLGFRKGAHTVTVKIERGEEEAELRLEELENAVAVKWDSPDSRFQRIIFGPACKTILHRMRETITP